jgi:putative transposase
MTRLARVVVPGCPHHLLQRGNHKENVFRDDSDRLVYLRLMRESCKLHRLSVWAYALMDNHVHHVAVPEHEASLSMAVKEAHGEYSRYINAKYGLVGHAWQGRFKSVAMDEAHCWNAIRYVERNPVRAGIVKRAEEYVWSSAAAHCGLRADPMLSGDCPLVGAVQNWSDWLRIEDKDQELDLIRKHTRIGRPLGPREFVMAIEERSGRTLLPKRPGPPRRADGEAAPAGDLFG